MSERTHVAKRRKFAPLHFFVKFLHPFPQLFVGHVRRDAKLRAAVHLLGTDLYFYDARFRRYDGCMERLVAVRLREGDIILKLTRQRFVERVDDAERRVTILNLRHDDTQCGDVVNEVISSRFLFNFLM